MSRRRDRSGFPRRDRRLWNSIGPARSCAQRLGQFGDSAVMPRDQHDFAGVFRVGQHGMSQLVERGGRERRVDRLVQRLRQRGDGLDGSIAPFRSLGRDQEIRFGKMRRDRLRQGLGPLESARERSKFLSPSGGFSAWRMIITSRGPRAGLAGAGRSCAEAEWYETSARVQSASAGHRSRESIVSMTWAPCRSSVAVAAIAIRRAVRLP